MLTFRRPIRASGRQGSPEKISWSPLSTLKWNLGRTPGSCLHLSSLGLALLSYRCSISGSSYGLAFPLHSTPSQHKPMIEQMKGSPFHYSDPMHCNTHADSHHNGDQQNMRWLVHGWSPQSSIYWDIAFIWLHDSTCSHYPLN